MKRYLPLIGVLSVLVVGGLITAVVAGAASGGGGGQAERQNDSAGMCAPGVVDCDDMIEPGDDPAGSACLAGATDCADDPSQGPSRCVSPDDPGSVVPECNDTFDCTADPEACVAVDPICVDDGTGECVDSIDGIDPDECSAVHNIEACQGSVPSGPVTSYDLTIGFNESVTQTDLEEIGKVIEEIAPGSEFLVRESFPPVGAARVTTDMVSFCADIEAKFESLPFVTDVACAVVADAAPGDPDEPVSSAPE